MFDERTPDFSDEPHADQALGIGDTPPGHFEGEDEDGFAGDLDDDPHSSPFDSPLNDAPVGDLGGPESEENLDDIMKEEMKKQGLGGESGGGVGGH